MATLQTGKSFTNGEQITADKLNQMVNDAQLSDSSVDGSTLTLNANGAIAVRSQGIKTINLEDFDSSNASGTGVTTIKLADQAVTLAKIAQTELFNKIYPVGSVYMNWTDDTNPGTLFGVGNWELFSKGRMLVGYDETNTRFDATGKTGGEEEVTLQLSQMPKHDHIPNRNTFDTANILLTRASDGSNTPANTDTNIGEINLYDQYGIPDEEGGDQPHENMPPYFTVYMWRRMQDS
jgi:hypothetical protein